MAEKLKPVRLAPQATAQGLQLSVPSEDRLGRLARSLDEFSGNIAGIAVRKANEAAEKEREAGRRAGAEAVAAGRATEAELLEAKIITRGEGSFFRDGVMQMAGQAHADAFSAALTIKASEDDLHNSVDPDAMDDLVEEMSAEFSAEGQGEAFSAGFADRAAQLVTGHKARHAVTVAGNLETLNNDQLTDLLRGAALAAADGVDPEFLVESLRISLTETGGQWRANLQDEKPRDLRLLNKQTTATIAGLVREGILNEDQAKELMKSIPGGTGPLWTIQKHADVVEAAIDDSVSRQQHRIKFEEDTALRAQHAAEADYMERMFNRAGESGLLDTSEIIAASKEDSSLFTTRYVADMEQLSLVFESAAQDVYISNQAMRRDYGIRILSGENISLHELSLNSVGRGKLSLDDAIFLGNLNTNHQNMLRNNPVQAGMWMEIKSLTKGGLSAWSGSEFGTQQYLAALPSLGEAWELFLAENEGKGLTAESPEFLKWASGLVEQLQRTYMLPDQWRTLQETQADQERANKVEPYLTTVFQANPDTLKQWYAEALMMQQGRTPSQGLLTLFNTPGHVIPDEAPVEDFAQAILGQLAQVGIDVRDEDTKAEIDAILLRMTPLSDDEAVEGEVGAVPGEEDRPSLFKADEEGNIPELTDILGGFFTQFLEETPQVEEGKIPTIRQLFVDAVTDEEDEGGPKLTKRQPPKSAANEPVTRSGDTPARRRAAQRRTN